MHDTPRSLLERLRDQPDEDAWRRLVELYTPFIHRWLRQHHVPSHDVDDVCQEVLAVVIRRLPEFEHSGRQGAFRRWLRLLVFHRIVGYWRSQKTELGGAAGVSLAELEDPESDLARAWDAEHDAWVARRLLNLLESEFTATTWAAFRRLVVDDSKPADVAAELGLTVNAVLLAKFRVLKRFREEVRGLVE